MIASATVHVSRDKTGRSKWSHELVENSNAIDRFFRGANTLMILVVKAVKLAQKNRASASEATNNQYTGHNVLLGIYNWAGNILDQGV